MVVWNDKETGSGGSVFVSLTKSSPRRILDCVVFLNTSKISSQCVANCFDGKTAMHSNMFSGCFVFSN